MNRYVAIIIVLLCVVTARAQVPATDTLAVADTLAYNCRHAMQLKPRPLQALGLMVLSNSFIHLSGRYLGDEPFSKVTLHSIRRNMKSGFAWDDDTFFLNAIGHPYQGLLDFNAARSSGFTFWQSVPFTAVGSLLWEYVGEREKPSINDMISTTLAGTMFGEIAYRTASHVIDEGERGASRVAREAVAFMLNPPGSLERLLNGRMWKVRRADAYAPAAEDGKGCAGGVSLGYRYLAAPGHDSHVSHQPFVQVLFESGEAADGEAHAVPFDFFSLDGMLAFGRRQSVVARLDLTGRLFSTPVIGSSKGCGELGLYQYYYADDSHLPDSVASPFPFAEVASLGPGLQFSFPRLSPSLSLQQRVNLRGVALGFAYSDYYNVYRRRYNMGSGYGASVMSRLQWNGRAALQLDAHYLHLFTWKGYEPRDISGYVYDGTPLNVMGDRSHARLFTLRLLARARLNGCWRLAVGASLFSRHTHYKYHSDRHADAYELQAGIECTL